MIVVAILGLLLVILQDSYSRWSRKFKVESEAKALHSYLLDARARAITRYRAHFVVTSGANYSVVEDTTPWPDGNGTYDTGAGGDNVVTMEGEARIDLRLPPASDDGDFQARYGRRIEGYGWTPEWHAAHYPVPIVITPTRWRLA